MSYEPKEWVCGETITADALNNIENGIADASSVFIVNFTNEGGTWVADKTFSEIKEALLSDNVVKAIKSDMGGDVQCFTTEVRYMNMGYELVEVTWINAEGFTNYISCSVSKATVAPNGAITLSQETAYLPLNA